MIFQAGLLFVLLGTAIMMFFIKVPFKEVLMFVSCAIFIALGFILYADYDIAFDSTSSVSDGQTLIVSNTTNYLIGDARTDYNLEAKYLALFFMIIGIIIGAISFIMFTNTKPRGEQ